MQRLMKRVYTQTIKNCLPFQFRYQYHYQGRTDKFTKTDKFIFSKFNHAPISPHSPLWKTKPINCTLRRAATFGIAAYGTYLLSSYVYGTQRDGLICHASARNRSEFSSQRKGQTFLEICQVGDVKMLKERISAGQDVNERHSGGWTALMVAAVNNQTEAARILLEAGADPDAHDAYDPSLKKDEKAVYNFMECFYLRRTRRLEFTDKMDEDEPSVGYTALHYAVLVNAKEIVALLYEYGADGTLKNSHGDSAADLPTASEATRRLVSKCQQQQISKRNPEVFKRVKLGDILRTNLVGQDLAVDQVTSVITRLETGWTNSKHPMVLLFVGGTGLGKTEMAKILAKYLHGNGKDSFVHINLSEYQTQHEAAKFIGAPPGYVGYDSSNEGQLLKILKKNPKCVVLFDEADKAHPNVLSTLLQLFDEGRLTSGSGKTVECNEALFVMTANLAVSEIKMFSTELRKMQSATRRVGWSPFGVGRRSQNDIQEFIKEFKNGLLHGPLKDAFERDELLGRINEVAIFLPFSLAERKLIVEQQLGCIRKMAAGRHGITLTWQPLVVELLDRAYNETYGARNVKYEIDRQIVSKLSEALERRLYQPGDFLHLETGTLLDDDTSREFIRLCKMSPINESKNLDIHFSELSNLFKVQQS